MSEENGIPTRPLGSTGERVSIIGVGGHHIARGDEALGIRIIRTAIDAGVTFMDNAWCYHDGKSEVVMGKALRDGYRERVFLMTKNHGRSRWAVRAGVEDSLRRLQVDCIDLVQFHETNHEGLPALLFADNAVSEMAKLRDEGKLRFIGFTGHRWPHLLLEMLERSFPWDTVQMPVNLLDAHFRSFHKNILPALKTRGIGAIGMKSLAAGKLIQTGVTAEEGIRYGLSQPVDVLVTGMESLEILAQNLKIARGFTPLNATEQAALLARVEPFARDGQLEEYKTGW
jgi:aryl-alcohol dehydrogenase-like predicted oxidoreductase